MKTKTLIFVVLVLGLSCGKDKDFQATILEPTATTLLFPENVSQCIEGTILSDTESELIFRWSPTENTDTFELHIENLLTSTIDIYSTANTEFPVVLTRGIPYAWFVNSQSANNSQAAQSETWTFYNAGEGITQYIPFPATALAPSSGSILTSTSVTLTWEAVDLDSDIESYDLYFGTMSPPELFQAGLTSPSLSGISVTSNTTYFWKITTKDRIGNESNSNIFYFEVN